MSPKKATFGETVRTLRVQQGIGLRQFAKLVGMSPTYLSKVERSDFPPPGEQKIKAIAEALDQDADELLALAGRVASDLTEVIKKHPKDMAAFLRTVRQLPADKVRRVLSNMKKQT